MTRQPPRHRLAGLCEGEGEGDAATGGGVACVFALGGCQKQEAGSAPSAAIPAPNPPPVAPKAYDADGGGDDFHGAGTICELSKPFSIGGGGVIVVFTPTNPKAGT